MVTKKQTKEEKFEKVVEQKAERFETFMDASADGFKKSVIRWLRTSQFFDGMVNTPARILINSMSLLALYVWGAWVFLTERQAVAWTITLFILLGMQAASVRFLFQTDGIADELQSARRNKSYRKAYSRIRTILIILVLVAASRQISAVRKIWLYNGSYTFIDDYRAMVFAVFLIALITFQKYFSYGWIGEPFTVREKSAIKD